MVQVKRHVHQSAHICFPHFFAVLEVFLLTDVQQTHLLDVIVEGFEAELGTSGGQRLNNSEQIEKLMLNTLQESERPALMMKFTC